MRISASRLAWGVSEVINASQSVSALAPITGFNFLQSALSSSSSIFEENRLGFGLFVSLPDHQEIAQDINDVPPAFHLLFALLFLQVKHPLIKAAAVFGPAFENINGNQR